MGFASKTARKKLSTLKRIVSEFNAMDVTIQRVGIQSGDTLFFKVAEAPRPEVLESFLQHLHTKGLRDCMAMIVGPEDHIETMSAERLDELATAAGYHKIDPVAELFRGRRQVLHLLQKIESEEGVVLTIPSVIARVRDAIEQLEKKALGEPAAEVPSAITVDPDSNAAVMERGSSDQHSGGQLAGG